MKVGTYLNSPAGMVIYLGKQDGYHYWVEKKTGKFFAKKILPKTDFGTVKDLKREIGSSYPKKGEYFKSHTGETFIFEKFDPKKPAVIYFLSENSEERFSSTVNFIGIKLGKIDQIVASSHQIIESMTGKILVDDLVRIGLSTFRDCFRSYDSVSIKRIGAIVEGEGYFHEVDEYFPIQGLIIESETSFSVKGEICKSHDIGFYGVRIKGGLISKAFPYFFTEGNSRDVEKALSFDNGYGDRVKIVKTIYSAEDVESVLENIDLNLYQK